MKRITPLNSISFDPQQLVSQNYDMLLEDYFGNPYVENHIYWELPERRSSTSFQDHQIHPHTLLPFYPAKPSPGACSCAGRAAGWLPALGWRGGSGALPDGASTRRTSQHRASRRTNGRGPS